MIYFVVLVIIFVIILILPFLLSMLFNANASTKPLVIHSDNVKDPRYFSKSFCKKMDEALAAREPGANTITLSHEEPFLWNNGAPVKNEHLSMLVVEAGPRFSTEHSTFDKEIYARGDAYLGEDTELRAIASLGHLSLARGVRVQRWADGQKGCQVGDDCDLGMSLSGDGPIVMGDGCRFHRVFAPMIHIGSDFPESSLLSGQRDMREPVVKDILFNAKNLSEDEVLDSTVITERDFLVREGAIVHGDIKSNGNIRIMSNSLVSGGVFADGSIVIEENVRVQGDVFSQEQIVVGTGAVIGIRGRVKSLIARKSIYLCEGATVYGYIGSEDESLTIDRDSYWAYANKAY